jgi:hypothetical protein
VHGEEVRALVRRGGSGGNLFIEGKNGRGGARSGISAAGRGGVIGGVVAFFVAVARFSEGGIAHGIEVRLAVRFFLWGGEP